MHTAFTIAKIPTAFSLCMKSHTPKAIPDKLDTKTITPVIIL